ncbi:MAG: carbamate kinase, partial [Fusobacteriaceae bacterium]
PEFKNPTKPIGRFYTKEESDKLVAAGATMKEDSGRGYRFVIASPKPVDVVEKETVKTLMDANQLVITVGGGGIPVAVDGNNLVGMPAVIDKDFASALLASLIDADMLIILTAVEKVAINFGKPDVKWLETMNIEEANQYINEGHFAPGSMLPKVEAAINFAKTKKGRTALITLLEKADLGIQGKTGTRISL